MAPCTEHHVAERLVRYDDSTIVGYCDACDDRVEISMPAGKWSALEATDLLLETLHGHHLGSPTLLRSILDAEHQISRDRIALDVAARRLGAAKRQILAGETTSA